MKVVAYSVKSYEKEFLAIANQRKHEITLVTNPLNADTVKLAEGKDAVLVFTTDDVSAGVIIRLAALGVRFIATRSAATEHIDKDAAATWGLKLANVPLSPAMHIHGHQYDAQSQLTSDALQQIADCTIKNLDLWQQSKCVGKACICAKGCSRQ